MVITIRELENKILKENKHEADKFEARLDRALLENYKLSSGGEITIPSKPEDPFGIVNTYVLDKFRKKGWGVTTYHSMYEGVGSGYVFSFEDS